MHHTPVRTYTVQIVNVRTHFNSQTPVHSLGRSSTRSRVRLAIVTTLVQDSCEYHRYDHGHALRTKLPDLNRYQVIPSSNIYHGHHRTTSTHHHGASDRCAKPTRT